MNDKFKNLISSSNILSKLYNALDRTNRDVFFKIRLDAYPRNQYAYLVYCGALGARRLNIPRIAVLEFGVAGGNGLLQMEDIAAEVEAAFDIRIDVHGFDSGEGMPPPLDYRDAPHVWKLHLGNVSETVPKFREASHAPIAAISFDLDYYSSTVAAFRIFEDPCILPRVMCYFDDIANGPVEAISSLAGERRAIADYNAAHADKIIDPDWSLDAVANSHAFVRWASRIRIWHDVNHPRATDYVGSGDPAALSLR